MKRNLFLISMLIPAVLPAGNLLRNSSFELDGAWDRKHVRFDFTY